MNYIKSFIHKFKKQSKPLRISFLIIGLAYFISVIFFSKSIISLVGIETVIRVVGLSVLFIYLFIYFFVGIILLFTKRKKSLIVLLVFAGILTPILSLGSFYIDKTYGIIDNVQKKYVTYTSYMVALKDTNEYKTIGMINAENDPTGYVIPKEIIKKYDINGKIEYYDNYISIMSDLYDGKIDAMFVSNSYVTMFNTFDKFKDIENETKVVYEMSKELENVDNISYSTKSLTEPFTVLLMGVDATEDGISAGSSFNGDTLMMITFNPKTLSATIFSIPRDTFVPISCFGNNENKINSSAYGGTSCVVETIENLTDIKIDYYVKINFNGVVKLVDDVGGIKVNVPISFCEQDSQRRFEEYEICLTAGEQTLNGEEALALARHRKTLLTGDFQRVQHQQLVVEALIESLKNVKDIDSLYKILNDVSNNVDTNITTPQILSLYNVAKNVLLKKVGNNATFSITKTYLTGYDLTIYMPSADSFTYTFQYYRNSLKDITDAMKVNLEIIKPKLIKTFEFSANENYKPKVIGETYYDEERRDTLPDFYGNNKTEIEAYAKERSLNVNYEGIPNGHALYNATLVDGTVVAQYPYSGTLEDTIDTITISVIDNTLEPIETEEENISQDEEKKDTDIIEEKDPIEDLLPTDEESTSLENEESKKSNNESPLSYSGLDIDEESTVNSDI